MRKQCLTILLTLMATGCSGCDHLAPGTNNNNNDSDIFRTPDNANKGIRGFLFRDGPNGVNLAAQLPQGKNGYSTTFPVPMARGASFDMDLEYQVGTSIGDEVVASGNTILLA